MDHRLLERRRSGSSESINSAYLDWSTPPLRNGPEGTASAFADSDLGVNDTHGFARSSIALTPVSRMSRPLSPFSGLSSTQGSDSGTATPKPDHAAGAAPDDPAAEDPLVAKDAEKEPAGRAAGTRVSSLKIRGKRCLEDWWVWEALSAVVSIACMAAIAVLALHIDNTALANWTFVMAPNTIISTLITIAKTSMLLPVAEGLSQLKWIYFRMRGRPLSELEAFDNASRGPWGSIVFFWRIRARSLLALCGCFLTVAALAMGPFAQQIVAFETRNVARPGVNSSISVSNTYDTDITRQEITFSADNWSRSRLVDKRVQGALFNGIFNSMSEFGFLCQSGNCTWGDFSSLGICSTCVNVTESTRLRGTESEARLITPDGTEHPLNPMWVMDLSNDPLDYTASSILTPYISLDYTIPIIVNISIVQFTNGHEWKATQCHIEWCMKLYQNVTATNGVLEDFPVQEIPIRMAEVQGANQTDNFTLSDSWSTLITYTAAAMDGPRIDTTSLSPSYNETFAIKGVDFVAMQSLMDEVLNYTSGSESYEFTVCEVLTYDVNVSAVMHNVADSITNVIRTSRNATVAKGIVWQSEAFIVVQWAWLILPIALVVLSTAFLATTALINAFHRAPLWKSALLPFLFHSKLREKFDEDEKREIADGMLERRWQMEDKAKMVGARLQRIDEGEISLVRE